MKMFPVSGNLDLQGNVVKYRKQAFPCTNLRFFKFVLLRIQTTPPPKKSPPPLTISTQQKSLLKM